MKNKLNLVSLMFLIFLLLEFPSYSQQQYSNEDGLGTSPINEPHTPYFGVPPYSASRPFSSQRVFTPGMSSEPPAYYSSSVENTGRSRLEQPGQMGSNRRRCDIATSVVSRPPSPPVSHADQSGAISINGSSTGSAANDDGLEVIGLFGAETAAQNQDTMGNTQKLGLERARNNTGGKFVEKRDLNSGSTLPTFEPMSSVEAAFYEIPAFRAARVHKLKQYGYSLFESPTSTFTAVENVPVGPDYILGPGDDLLLNVWGSMEGQILLTVDRKGEIKLPSAGPVRVWGLGFSQADKLIRKALSQYYRGFNASLTMGQLRTITVYVVGEVCQPGAFTLSSLSTITNGLFAAGGPLKLGSLRNIELKRNRRTIGELDLYDFLLRGEKTHDFRLQSGDTIFVPPIGSTVGIYGEVKRPAIYEIRDETSVRELIEMAGGVTPRSYLKRVQIIRAKTNAEREVIDLDLTITGGNGNSPHNFPLRSGDFVKIYPTDPRIYNIVRLDGAVKYPGEYELKHDMKLSDLLPKGSLLPEAFPNRVEIARLQGDLTTEIIVANLSKAWKGDKTQDVLLNRMDLISIKSDFKVPASVKLKGEIVRPGTYRISTGERLSSVLLRAGGFTEKAFLRGAVFTRKSVEAAERRRLNEFVTYQEQLLLADTSQKGDLNLRREQLKLLASKIILGRVVVHLDQPDILAGSSNDIVLMDGDTLELSQSPATVLVMGSVRNPTAVLHWNQGDVHYYINRAGGLTPDADEKQIYVISADGSAIAGFMKLRDVQAGDGIIVPPSIKRPIEKMNLFTSLAGVAGSLSLTLASLLAIF